MRSPLFWDVIYHHWVLGSRHFKTSHWPRNMSKKHIGVQHHILEEWILHILFLANILLFICFRDPEPQILDYRTQQYKLFPYLAASFAVRFAGIQLWNMYKDVVSELAGGDLERLPEVKCFICLCTYCTEINIHFLLLSQ